MQLPYAFDFHGSKTFILKFNQNLYGVKNASQNFWNLLKDGLEAREYERQINAHSCVFLGKESIVLVHIDDCIIINRRGSKTVDNLIKSLKEGHENFDFIDDRNLKTYLGVDIKRHTYGRIELTHI